LRSSLTHWLVLIDASGALQNSVSQPWVHIELFWGVLKNTKAGVSFPVTVTWLVWERFGLWEL
jgi:hypothetical protein